MNLTELMNQKRNLGAQILAAAEKVTKADASNEEVKAANEELVGLQDRMAALDNAIAVAEAAHGELKPIEDKKEEQKTMDNSIEIRKSNEYVRAFAYALRNGITPRNGRGNEHVKVLFDALTEGGGATPGEDGGFLVPVDIDNQINELKRALAPLAPFFSGETVTAPTGWRVIDTAPTTGMTQVNEMGTIPKDDQPAFQKVPYALEKYGLIVPVSNELLSDEVANLMGYLARWFAKKEVITENNLIITALKTLTPAAMGSATIDPISALKTILNEELDPAIAAGAIILTNQTGFNALDQLTDEMGRGLLQPDPTNSTIKRALDRRVVVASNAVLANVDSKAPFFVGDGMEFGTLFRKGNREVASTNIGGNAWATDSTEVRGISRMCFTKFDTAAMTYKQLTLA